MSEQRPENCCPNNSGNMFQEDHVKEKVSTMAEKMDCVYDQDGSTLKRKINEVARKVHSCSVHDHRRKKRSDHDETYVVEKDGANTEVCSGAVRMTEDLQCTHTDGKQWRCKQQDVAGHKYCEHDSVHIQTSTTKNIDAISDSEDEDKNVELVPVMRQGLKLPI